MLDTKMKKYFKSYFFPVVTGLFIPVFSALAANITNPAPGLFVGPKGDGSFGALFMFIINSIMLPLAGIVAMTFIIIGGYQYITSSGDEELAAKGKKTLSNAVIGLVVVILSYIIVTVVINAISGKV